jgi:hypothetical protein
MTSDVLMLPAGPRRGAVLLLLLGSFTAAFAQSGDSSRPTARTELLAPLERAFAQAMWLPHMKDAFPNLAHLLPAGDKSDKKEVRL